MAGDRNAMESKYTSNYRSHKILIKIVIFPHMSMNNRYTIGSGKSEIKCFKESIGMMGYGMPENIVKKQETPLYARSFLIKDESNNLTLYTCCEIAFIAPSIKRIVLDRIQSDSNLNGIEDHNFLLTAQHTHSAPGGFFHYPFYNVTSKGFHQDIQEAIIEGIVSSIKMAASSQRENCTIELKKHQVPENVEIAWNRSIHAYNSNFDQSIANTETHKAVNREMVMLTFHSSDKNQIGSINFFGVHATCVGNTNQSISSDNKGYAAKFMEEAIPDSISIFAQSETADVSPYYHGPNDVKLRGEIHGKDEHVYAENHGKLQYEQAMKTNNSVGNLINGSIASSIMISDFSNLKSSPKYSNNDYNAYTTEGIHGTGFFAGTPVDGPGISPGLKKVLDGIAKVVKFRRLKLGKDKEHFQKLYTMQEPKSLATESKRKRMFGSEIHKCVIPSFTDPAIKEVKKQSANGALDEHALIPNILPLQLIRIGQLILIGCPGEITTVGGAELKALVLKKLKPEGVEEVILSSYANCYMGYITTYSEYLSQSYEAGHTPFGKWTHAALLTEFEKVCDNLIEGTTAKYNTQEPIFSEKTLKLRSFS